MESQAKLCNNTWLASLIRYPNPNSPDLQPNAHHVICKMPFLTLYDWAGGVFDQVHGGFLPVLTLEAIKVHSGKLVDFPKIL